MLNTKLLRNPLFLQTERKLFGSHNSGWSLDLDSHDALLSFPTIEKHIPSSVWEHPKAMVLVPEVACFPIKVLVEKKIKERDLEPYLKWNLKKRLPFPSENAIIRYVHLKDSPHYLVFSLPGSWVEETFAFFKSRGVQLGYLGSIAGLFLERMRNQNGQLLLVFEHYYVYFEKQSGSLLHYQLRRYPEEGGRIIFEEFFPHDFANYHFESPKIICFSENRYDQWRTFLSSSPKLGMEIHFEKGNLAHFLQHLGQKA